MKTEAMPRPLVLSLFVLVPMLLIGVWMIGIGSLLFVIAALVELTWEKFLTWFLSILIYSIPIFGLLSLVKRGKILLHLFYWVLGAAVPANLLLYFWLGNENSNAFWLNLFVQIVLLVCFTRKSAIKYIS